MEQKVKRKSNNPNGRRKLPDHERKMIVTLFVKKLFIDKEGSLKKFKDSIYQKIGQS
jgi:hypothetical protein